MKARLCLAAAAAAVAACAAFAAAAAAVAAPAGDGAAAQIARYCARQGEKMKFYALSPGLSPAEREAAAQQNALEQAQFCANRAADAKRLFAAQLANQPGGAALKPYAESCFAALSAQLLRENLAKAAQAAAQRPQNALCFAGGGADLSAAEIAARAQALLSAAEREAAADKAAYEAAIRYYSGSDALLLCARQKAAAGGAARGGELN